jgi:hypothetical protein
MHTLSKGAPIRPSRTMDTLGALSFIDTRGIHYYGKCVTSHSRLTAFLVDADQTMKKSGQKAFMDLLNRILTLVVYYA